MHGLRTAASQQSALQHEAMCDLEHGALVRGEFVCVCVEVTALGTLEDLPKFGHKEPGSFSRTVKSVCPWISGVQGYRTCPFGPPTDFSSWLAAMSSYKHNVFLKTVHAPAPLVLVLYVLSSLVCQSFPHSCIFT